MRLRAWACAPGRGPPHCPAGVRGQAAVLRKSTTNGPPRAASTRRRASPGQKPQFPPHHASSWPTATYTPCPAPPPSKRRTQPPRNGLFEAAMQAARHGGTGRPESQYGPFCPQAKASPRRASALTAPPKRFSGPARAAPASCRGGVFHEKHLPTGLGTQPRTRFTPGIPSC